MLNELLQTSGAFLTSLCICMLSIPTIMQIAEKKALFDVPDGRKIHKNNISSLGGLAIFGGFIFSSTFWSTRIEIVELQFIIAALMLLLFAGLKDDLIGVSAKTKFLILFCAASITVLFTDIQLTSMYGMLGIRDVPPVAGVFLSLFTLLLVSNAFNLIDGVDLLAALLGLFACVFFGIWFYLVNHVQYTILAFSLAGGILGFCTYNKPPAKIFMGDLGSLTIGFVVAVLAIKFIELNRHYQGPPAFFVRSVPAVAMSVIIVPLFDTLRVFVIRVLKKQSPFVADRNHLHHILLFVTGSHLKTVVILVLLNMVLAFLALWLTKMVNGDAAVLINLSLMVIFSIYIAGLRRQKLADKPAANIAPSLNL